MGRSYVVEFQAQPAAGAWYNLLTKIGLYGEEHPDRDVRGLLILAPARATSRAGRAGWAVPTPSPRRCAWSDSCRNGWSGNRTTRLSPPWPRWC
ncbi:MAG: Rpn family recombination-promoting nuclease/putative transposase [Chromatiales bacterium]|nr:Rpn family recombination-promoting nuclease/putative transposase [Chromatiales bacterium]